MQTQSHNAKHAKHANMEDVKLRAQMCKHRLSIKETKRAVHSWLSLTNIIIISFEAWTDGFVKCDAKALLICSVLLVLSQSFPSRPADSKWQSRRSKFNFGCLLMHEKNKHAHKTRTCLSQVQRQTPSRPPLSNLPIVFLKGKWLRQLFRILGVLLCGGQNAAR